MSAHLRSGKNAHCQQRCTIKPPLGLDETDMPAELAQVAETLRQKKAELLERVQGQTEATPQSLAVQQKIAEILRCLESDGQSQ